MGGDPINYTDIEGLQRECAADFCIDAPEPVPGNPGPPAPPFPPQPVPPITLGQPGPGPYSAPVWTGFSKRDGGYARRAQDLANRWVKDERCDHALVRYGVKSVGDALGIIQFSGKKQNVWNGQNSTFVTRFADAKGTVYTLGVHSTSLEQGSRRGDRHVYELGSANVPGLCVLRSKHRGSEKRV